VQILKGFWQYNKVWDFCGGLAAEPQPPEVNEGLGAELPKLDDFSFVFQKITHF